MLYVDVRLCCDCLCIVGACFCLAVVVEDWCLSLRFCYVVVGYVKLVCVFDLSYMQMVGVCN